MSRQTREGISAELDPLEGICAPSLATVCLHLSKTNILSMLRCTVSIVRSSIVSNTEDEDEDSWIKVKIVRIVERLEVIFCHGAHHGKSLAASFG